MTREGDEWEPFKILQENKAYVENSIPTHLSSNCQGDTSQHVSSSPYERLEKTWRKTEAIEK